MPRILNRAAVDALFEQAYQQLEERRVKVEMDAAIIAAVEGVADPILAAERAMSSVRGLHQRLVDSVLARGEE